MDNKVKWTPTCEQSFQSLKKKLTEFPVLVTPDRKRMFILQTDASDTGLGFVLSQINEDGEETPSPLDPGNHYHESGSTWPSNRKP